MRDQQAQDELLRQRERELGAVKGALKEEVASHDQEVEELKQQFQENVQRLRTDYEEAYKARFGGVGGKGPSSLSPEPGGGGSHQNCKTNSGQLTK